jgi:hypothetical protein
MLPAGRDGKQRPRRISPRPDEIATRRFSRKLWGAHPRQVQRELLELAAALERSRAAQAREMLEQHALEKSVQATSAAIQDLQQQLSAARGELMILQTAGAAALDVLRAARMAAQALRRSVDVAAVIEGRPAPGDDS